MGLQFDWQVDEEPIRSDRPSRGWLGRLLLVLLTISLFVLLKPQPPPPAPDAPPQITYAAPSNQLSYFLPLAKQFMAENPDQTIIVVDQDAVAADPAQLLLQVDAAALTPDVALLETGIVHPLDDLIAWDNDAFYPQIRAGIEWDDQLWVWPYAMQMNLLYIDNQVIKELGLENPAEGWHFWRFGRQLNTIADNTERDGYLLSSRDLLFSYAYAHHAAPLDDVAIESTIAWLDALLATEDAITDLSLLDTESRKLAHLRAVSADREAAIWTTHPGLYEYHAQLDPVTIIPYPYNDDFERVAPLHIQGSVISRTSRNPQLAMAWLDYISQQLPPGGNRLIPVRESVAQSQRYWQTLPDAMQSVMREAFVDAQAITLADNSTLTWERVSQPSHR